MTNGKDDIGELEELLTELRDPGVEGIQPYDEDDDAVTQMMEAPLDDEERLTHVASHGHPRSAVELPPPPVPLPPIPLPSVPARLARPTPPPPAPLPPAPGLLAVAPLSPRSTPRASSPLSRAPTPLPPPPRLPPPPTPAWSNGVSGPLGSSPEGARAPGALASMGEASPARPTPLPPTVPSTARTNTTRPVAIDFSPTAPVRNDAFRAVFGSGAAALATIIVTSFALSAGGVFQSTPTVAAPATAPLATITPEPPAAPAPEPAAAAPEAATELAAVVEPPTAAPAPAVAEAPAATTPEPATPEPTATAATMPSSPATEAATPSADEAEPAPRAKVTLRKKAAPRLRTAQRPAATEPASEEAASTEEVAPRATPSRADASQGTFNMAAAKAALDGAAQQAKNCRPAGGPTGNVRVQVRYEPTGKVAAVSILTPEFANSISEGCITMLFRRASVPTFTGAPAVVMSESFEIP